ncbi:MAG: hypothetical protein A2027_00165 [Thermodesulfovibrio sp. RBG_19FT_COMBO_41_18]|nr:MAG: hypothetical protein A2027_00165 [Thermodesulfovibrio sp. RBG_19FT_COMBO_41_18]
MAKSDNVLLDLNNPVFQDDLFNIEKEDTLRILDTLKKIKSLTWTAMYNDKGLRWELIQSRTRPSGQRLYTIRISQKFRAVVYREEQFMRFLSLHPDHDSAYK